MISHPRRLGSYADRDVDCQEAMEPGFQAIVDCMVEAGWLRAEVLRALRRLIAADSMETDLAIARAMIRAGKNF